MNRELSADERIVVERLLTRLASRLDGAIDFWTLVCLGRAGPDPRGFLLHHGETVKSLIVVTEDLLAGTAQGSAESVRDLLGRLSANARRFQETPSLPWNSFAVCRWRKSVRQRRLWPTLTTTSAMRSLGWGKLWAFRSLAGRAGRRIETPIIRASCVGSSTSSATSARIDRRKFPFARERHGRLCA